MLKPENLKITVVKDKYLGGQTVGDFSTGVEVEHIPTGLKAFCDYERSQMKNRKIAMLMIEYALAEMNIEE